MAENKKSIIESALLDIQTIQEALNSNTKEILRTVAIEEIDKVVKESITEADYEEEDVEDTELDLADADGGVELDVDADVDVDAEEATDDIELDNDEADMEDSDVELDVDYDAEEEEEVVDTDYEMDMTDASDEDVIAVYKKLSGDDEIEVVSDKEVRISDPVSGAEYHVKLDGGVEDAEAGVEADFDLDMDVDALPIEDEVEENVYEIALDEDVSENEEITEETKIGATADGKVRTATSDVTMGSETAAPNTGDIESQTAPVDNETSGDNLEGGFDDEGQSGSGDLHANHIMEEEVVEEENETVTEEEETVEENLGSTRGYAGRQGAKMGGDDHLPSRKDESVNKEYEKLLAENNKLKKETEEFKGALRKFKKMLGETVVFNTNLTNVTKLFTEHSTTRAEKEKIIARFDDEVTTIKESKRLYKTIVSELGNKKPIAESVENKIIKGGTTSMSTETQLNESTTYVDPSTTRIKDLISRVEKPRF